jgi:hypothetical protein
MSILLGIKLSRLTHWWDVSDELIFHENHDSYQYILLTNQFGHSKLQKATHKIFSQLNK